MSKPLLVDFHNHFDFMPSWINRLTDRFLKNKNSIQFLLDYLEKHDQRIIIGYALYSLPWIKNEFGEVIKQIELIERAASSLGKSKIKIIKNQDDLADTKFRMGITLHLESARWFHGDLTILKALHKRGVYGLIPVHYINNWYGGSCDDLSSKITLNHYQRGLTDQGKRLLDMMSDLNMWLDVSHMNQKTLEESLNHFEGAVAASHIGLQGVINVDRNLSDKSLQLLKQRDAIIGICAWSRITGRQHHQLKNMIDILLNNGMENQIVIGSDFGPPIHTASGNKSIFDFYQILNNLVADEKISDKMNSSNALAFLRRILPYECQPSRFAV